MIISLSPTGQKQSWSAPPTNPWREEQIFSFVTEHQWSSGTSRKQWEYAELAFQEVNSSMRCKNAARPGFSIESESPRMPTAF
jgi:metal-dependent amidase/aminoacylase/carboxypeptidase family protein